MGMKGSCLCRQVRYEVEDFEPPVTHCHCSMCRKFHGAAYATYGAVRRERFRWLAGRELLQYYCAANGTVRGFCRVCGASLSFHEGEDPAPARFHIALGTLDDRPTQLPAAHIHVASKAAWSQIDDTLPRYDGECEVN